MYAIVMYNIFISKVTPIGCCCTTIWKDTNGGSVRYATAPPKGANKTKGFCKSVRNRGGRKGFVCAPLLQKKLLIFFQVGSCVSQHPLGGAEHKTTSFPNLCR